MGRVLIIAKDGDLAEKLRCSALLREYEVQTCEGDVEGIRFVRERLVDVVVIDPATSIHEDLALVQELFHARPGLRTIVLAPAATHADLMALKAHVFACYTPPFDPNEIADMVRSALAVPFWRDGIEVISSLPHWVTLRVTCP